MASSSSLARFKGGSSSADTLETVEIDPQFASGLGFRIGDIVRALDTACLTQVSLSDFPLKVEIGLLQDLGVASSVVTEPVSTDDWEIIVGDFLSSWNES